MEVPWEMRMIPYLREALIDDSHPTDEGLEFLEDVERMDHLIEILMTMGHLVMEDILQDVDHQEVDHQEEDCLVHLEILDCLGKEDHQAREDLKECLDLKEKEDILVPQDLKDHQDHWEEQFDLPI